MESFGQRRGDVLCLLLSWLGYVNKVPKLLYYSIRYSNRLRDPISFTSSLLRNTSVVIGTSLLLSTVVVFVLPVTNGSSPFFVRFHLHTPSVSLHFFPDEWSQLIGRGLPPARPHTRPSLRGEAVKPSVCLSRVTVTQAAYRLLHPCTITRHFSF